MSETTYTLEYGGIDFGQSTSDNGWISPKITTGSSYLDAFSDMVRYPFDLTESMAVEREIFLLQKHLGFKIGNQEDVIQYILKNVNIHLVLVDALHAVADAFAGSESTLTLYQDPELNDEYLTIYVRMHPYPEHMFEKIDALLPRYQEKFTLTPGWLVITTDFVTV